MEEKVQDLEKKTADAILQQRESITIGGKTYSVAPPTLATLILVSKEISKLPKVQLNEERLMEDALWIAKDCAVLGKIVATLIIGAKEARKTHQRQVKHRRNVRLFGGLFHFGKNQYFMEQYDPVEELAQQIMEESTPREIQNATAKLLLGMQVGDFFGLTTFLLEANLTRQTKVETT